MSDSLQSFRVVIKAALGYAPEAIEAGRFVRFSTNGKPSDSSGWCRLFDDLRGGVFGCYRQGISETWSASERTTMTREQRTELARQIMAATADRNAQQCRRWTENKRRIARILGQCVPLQPGDPVSQYLKRRGLGGAWPLPGVLRLHRALPYWHGAEKLDAFPAMVVPIVAHDGRIVALHKTYLTWEGRKADVPGPVKKLSGACGSLTGASIQLGEPKRGLIGVAEGIETALAAALLSDIPTVAAYCANGVAQWRWPGAARKIVIFADHDAAGQDAAQTLMSRATRGGVRADLLVPSIAGADWLDVLAAEGVAMPGIAEVIQ